MTLCKKQLHKNLQEIVTSKDKAIAAKDAEIRSLW